MPVEAIISEDLTQWPISGWIKEGDHDIVTFPVLANYIYNNTAATQQIFEGASLFFWTDGGPLNDRTAWIRKTFTGLPPNTDIGVRVQSNWILRLNLFVFMELIGVTTNHVTLTDIAHSFWELPDNLPVQKKDNIAYVKSTPTGEITIKLGIEQAFRTNNLFLIFTSNLELVLFKSQILMGHIMKKKRI